MPSYAVTGAARGLGYALLTRLSADPNNTVVGIVRNVKAAEELVAKDLPDRKNLHLIHGDLTDYASLKSAADAVASITGGSLDVLIANAALVAGDFLAINDSKQDWEAFDNLSLESFKINALGNIHLFSHFVPLIQKGNLKKVVALSTGQADIDFINESGMLIQAPYSMSKIALNLAVAKYHVQYASEGILFMAISPGLVDTGLPSDVDPEEFMRQLPVMMNAMAKYAPNSKFPITPEESTTYVLDVIDKATIEKNGGIMVSHLGNKRWL
ncbi:hypothetical protein GE09DRAFT_208997 [Coniochaeta sp. 2T2.1]|nr:hypothetical protein GE09DRAFT_208997 [Coniochaeta sp. 2T2.1]